VKIQEKRRKEVKDRKASRTWEEELCIKLFIEDIDNEDY